MRPLQLHFLRNYQPGRDPLSRRVPLPPTIRLLFRRWSRTEFLRTGNPLRVPQPTITVTTDASHTGWWGGGGGGGHCRGRIAYGDWSRYRVLPHINVLEFQAVFLSLHHFLPLVRHCTVLIRTDNVTVAAYINKQGDTHTHPARLNTLAAELWTWCRHRDFIPTASYIPGQDNLITDFLSRGRVLPSEWILHPRPGHGLDSPNIRSPTRGSACVGTQCPAPEILHKGSGLGSVANRRLLVSVGGIHGVRFSPFSLFPRIL